MLRELVYELETLVEVRGIFRSAGYEPLVDRGLQAPVFFGCWHPPIPDRSTMKPRSLQLLNLMTVHVRNH